MILYLLSCVHQTCDRINVIMFISFHIIIQFHIIFYLYHIMCTKRVLKVFFFEGKRALKVLLYAIWWVGINPVLSCMDVSFLNMYLIKFYWV